LISRYGASCANFTNGIGWAIIVIALLHALAALYHHYGLRDRVLERMLPRSMRRREL